jgi:hypothetical protein
VLAKKVVPGQHRTEKLALTAPQVTERCGYTTWMSDCAADLASRC